MTDLFQTAEGSGGLEQVLKKRLKRMRRDFLQNVHDFVQSLSAAPFTLKKAVFIMFYAEGLRFAAVFLLAAFGISSGIVPGIIYLATVLVIARGMGRNELGRVFAWQDVPLPVFAGMLVMFAGTHIIMLELGNFLRMILPVPEDFFSGRSSEPENIFLNIVSGALFPGFTEEIFFRGIIARRFFRTYTARKAVLLSAMLFGIAHLNPWQAVNAFYAGIFLGWMYRRYKSIWLCMFIHAYHNVLVSYMSYPYVEMKNSYHEEMWRHPLWFDLLGIFLFGLGLLTLVVLGGKPGDGRESAKRPRSVLPP